MQAWHVTDEQRQRILEPHAARGKTNASRARWLLLALCLDDAQLRDLRDAARDLARQGRFDYLLIESAGSSEPMPVAATFDFRSEEGDCLGDVARLDTMVTVVDAAQLSAQYQSSDMLADRGEVAGADDHRALVQLLADQLEFADVVILNKLDAATPEQLHLVT